MFDFVTFPRLTRGNVADAWERCLPIWRRDGGVDDWHGVGGRTFYTPSRARRLGRYFAKRHHQQFEWVAAQTQNDDAFIALCAVDVLLDMTPFDSQIVPHLIASTLALPESVLETLVVDIAASSLGDPKPEIDTLGSYIRWQFHQPQWAK